MHLPRKLEEPLESRQSVSHTLNTLNISSSCPDAYSEYGPNKNSPTTYMYLFLSQNAAYGSSSGRKEGKRIHGMVDRCVFLQHPVAK